MSYRLLNEERQIFLKEGGEEPLRGACKIVFDFDGVLAQTRQSYRQTIRKVVDYYFLEMLGLEGDGETLTTFQDIQKFKDTGQYNNDWNLSYAFISYYLNLIMRQLELKSGLQAFCERFGNLQFLNVQSFVIHLKEAGNFLRCHGISGTRLAALKNDALLGLDLFLAQDSIDKPKPIETSLLDIDPEVAENKERLAMQLVPYDLEKPDLLKRLFEETYLGKDLFKKFYGVTSFFQFGESLLDKEEFIPTDETLDSLRRDFGKFIIYSGRPRPQGTYILEKYQVAGYFDEKESVFLGDLFKSEAEMEKLGKPDPTLFIELIEDAVGKDVEVVYIGDGIADAILIEKAKAQGFENLSFLGIASSSEDSNKLTIEYRKHGASATVRDVNDIPLLFAYMRRSV